MPRKKQDGLTKGQMTVLTEIFVKLLLDNWPWDQISEETRRRGNADLAFLVEKFPCWFPNYLTSEGVQLQINRAWWQAIQIIGQDYGLKVVQQPYGDPGVTFIATPINLEVPSGNTEV